MTHHSAHKQQKQTLRPSNIGTLTEADDKLSGQKFLYTIHNKRIAVLVSYDTPPEYDQRDTSIPARYLDRYDQAGWWVDGERTPENAEKRLDALLEELQDMIQDFCHKLMIAVAGGPSSALLPGKAVESDDEIIKETERSQPTAPPPRTLHEYMYSEAFVVQLISRQGEPKAIRREDIPPPTTWPAYPDIAALEEKTNIKLPIYTPSQIQVLKTFAFHPWVLRVSTPNGSHLSCKLSASHTGSFEREYGALRKLRDAGCTIATLRVPQLRGLVRTEAGLGEVGIVGILVDYIDTQCYELTFCLAPATYAAPGEEDGNAADDGSRSNDADGLKASNHIPDIEPSRREKWMSQIQTTVYKLHALGVVWGDAKTANILLDRNDDLWVVDFGGGGTPGWFDKKLMGTKEGDLQALKRILEEIGGKRRVWRSDEKQPTDPGVV
jgi:hypothetical protein